MRLPSIVNFPFGYRITVRQVLADELRESLEESDDLVDGLWVAESREILIHKAIAMKRKVEVLCHEVDHAVNDWRSWVESWVK